MPCRWARDIPAQASGDNITSGSGFFEAVREKEMEWKSKNESAIHTSRAYIYARSFSADAAFFWPRAMTFDC